MENRVVVLEGPILLENPFIVLAEQRKRARRGESEIHPSYEVALPSPDITRGVLQTVYEGYRLGLDSACADVVITTILPSGVPAALLAQRGTGRCHAGQWWFQGGAIHTYRSILDFLNERAEREIGIRPAIEGIIGVYRCAASDYVGCVLVVCYAGFVGFDRIKAASPDQDHIGNARLITWEQYMQLPSEQRHPYSDRVIFLALATTV